MTKSGQKSFFKNFSSTLVRYINPKRRGGKKKSPQDHDIMIKFMLLICKGVLFIFFFLEVIQNEDRYCSIFMLGKHAEHR